MVTLPVTRFRIPKRFLSTHLSAFYPLALGLTLLSPAFALDSSRNLTQYLHRIWQSPQGLPPAEIRSILQAPDGYIWLGTSAGVQRFDGIRFTPLPGMNDSSPVEQVIEDSSGNVWIATTQAGLFEYSGSQLRNHFSRANGLPSDTVLHLAAGPQGRIWAALADGEIVQIANGRVSRIGNSTQSPATSLAVDSRGIVWIGGDQASLRTWDGAHFENVPLPKSVPADATVQSLLWSADNTLWIGTSRGLLRMSSNPANPTRFFTKANGLAGNSVLALIPNSDGGVWIGTNEGFSRAKNGEIESFGAKQGLSQSTVYALAEDRENQLWVGTKRGLNQFLDRRTIPFTTAEGLPTNDVGPVFEDAAGSLWVGTLGQGLARKIHNGFTVMGKSQGLSSNFVEALAGAPDGSLWIGTTTGLDRLSDGKVVRTLRQFDGLPSSSIRSLYRDRSGLLWAGTAAGIAVLSDDRVILSRTFDSAVLSFTEDPAGHVYAATDRNGIQIFDGKNLAAPPRTITVIREADTLFADPADGSIWAGTIGNGLYRLTNAGAKIEHFSANDGLFDDDIYGIAADDRGSLWMACSKGIFSVNRADLDKFSAGAIHTIPSVPFSPLDGLQTVECKSGVQPAAWRLKDGRIAFSTIRGLLIVDPMHMELKAAPAPVAIEAVIVDGRSHDPDQIRELPPAERNLEFRYTGLSFRSPLRITFRYMLEDFNRDWIDAGSRREAYYTNLPPGHYRFRVKACNFEGNCDAISTDLSFTLAARFYQRVWFWPCVAALLGLGAWLGYQMRMQRLRGQFALVLSERNRIARELHDTLLQGFSGVTMQLQGLAARLPAQQRSSLIDIIQDSADCLKEARRSVADLRSQPRSGLAASIAKAAKQTKGLDLSRVRLKLEQIPPGLPDHVESNLLKIAQEALSNAARHSGARSIEVALRPTRDEIRLSIRDDGSGWAKIPRTSDPDGHFGLIGMKERAEHIGADFDLTSVPGVGTTITINLPLSRKTGNVHGYDSVN